MTAALDAEAKPLLPSRAELRAQVLARNARLDAEFPGRSPAGNGGNAVSSVSKPPFSSAASAASANVSRHQQSISSSSAASAVDVAFLVDDFIAQSTGIFTSYELCKWAGLVTREQRNAVSSKLLREESKNKITRAGARSGQWRKVESRCEAIDFCSASEEPEEIALPLGLGRLVELLPGNIVVVAGEPNAGKTAFLLNIVRANMHRADVHYFNSEMGAGELRKRLLKFGLPLAEWTFHAWERTGDFEDAVHPGRGTINIIDFLELSEDFYRVGGMLKAIHDRLSGALAIVALQKNRGVDLGLGGGRSLEKPRLYLSLAPGKCRIVKAKNWRTQTNPNGLEIGFKLVDGCTFLPQGAWRHAEAAA